jgi:hypothetical protein
MDNQDKNVGYKCFPNLVQEGDLVEPSIKLNVQKTLIGEFFCFSQNIGFIPLFQQGEILLQRHTRIS